MHPRARIRPISSRFQPAPIPKCSPPALSTSTQTYAQIGIRIEVGSSHNLSRPHLTNIAQERGEDRLFSIRDSGAATDVGAYFVLSPPWTKNGNIVNRFARKAGRARLVASTAAARVLWPMRWDTPSISITLPANDTHCPYTGPPHCCKYADLMRLMTAYGTKLIVSPCLIYSNCRHVWSIANWPVLFRVVAFMIALL